jgi:hypothetical protein
MVDLYEPTFYLEQACRNRIPSFTDELSVRASGTPRGTRLLSSRHRRRAFLRRKKPSITSDRSFSSGTFPYRRAQHDSKRRDRGTKIIIVFPGFPFVCTLRFPVRFFVTPQLNPRRVGEWREGKAWKNSRRNHRSVTFRHLYQILRWRRRAFDF